MNVYFFVKITAYRLQPGCPLFLAFQRLVIAFILLAVWDKISEVSKTSGAYCRSELNLGVGIGREGEAPAEPSTRKNRVLGRRLRMLSARQEPRPPNRA